MWRLISLFFLILSAATVVWLSYELDLFRVPVVQASERGGAASGSVEKTLDERAKKLDARDAELAKREADLKEKQAFLTTQMDRYEKTIDALKLRMKGCEEHEDARIESFRHVYERMDSKKAAKILDGLEVNLATEIIGGMKPDRSAEVLNEMSSEKARQVTEKILSKKRVVASTPANEQKQKTGQ